MLIRIFKKNYLSQYIIFTLMAFALWLPSFLNPPYVAAQEFTSPFYNIILSLSDSKLIWIIVSFIILYLQSFYLNIILISHDIISKTSFLGGLLYFILMSLFLEFQYFNPALLCNFFLIAAIHTLLKMNGKEFIFPDCFRFGFLIGMASLFYFPATFFIVMIWVTLLLFRIGSIRAWIIPITSFLTPYFFLFTYYFWFDKLQLFESYLKIYIFDITNVH